MDSRDLVEARAIHQALAERSVVMREVDTLSIVPSEAQIDSMLDRRVRFMAQMHLHSADMECKHGACPGDRVKPDSCSCFDPKPASVVALRIERMQVLTCRECGRKWEREPQRGRPPHTCPGCRS